jgi:integrase/recombinase XerD
MLGKQAKVLGDPQIRATLAYLESTRQPERNRVIFLLSLRAGLRAKEIAGLTWSMITDADGRLSNVIRLRDSASKGNSGGVIPMARDLQKSLETLLIRSTPVSSGQPVISTQRQQKTSPQVIVNMFRHWYAHLGFEGCSSHSGRRTFITRAARNIGRVGGSLRDVQQLARHQSLMMTQRYIEVDADAMRKVVDL